MIVKETTNTGEIKTVLCSPAIYPCISDDNSPEPDSFEPPISEEYQYIAGYVDSDIIGIMIYHSEEGRTNIHIQVLPEYRKEYAREFGRMALKFGEAKNVIIYAEIPECYPNVLEFAKSFGFKETGESIKNDCTKDGVKYDAIILRLNQWGL